MSQLRLPKKHASEASQGQRPDAELGERLWQAQRVAEAALAAIVAVIAFSIAWAMLSTMLGRVFPWLTVLLGAGVGVAVRRYGHGLDWRFPAIAAAATIVGALLGNIAIGAAFAAEELGVSTLTALLRVSSLTWPVFFDEVVTAADAIYALFAAGVAAFLANRRLTRRQFAAVRVWQQSTDAS